MLFTSSMLVNVLLMCFSCDVKKHFHPPATLAASPLLSYQFKVLMEHLDHDEEDEEGEASANARNKAINSLLKGSKPLNHNHNHHPVETDEEESADEDHPVVSP